MNNKKSKIGCFFGTFNPIHNGHMMMANYVLEHTDICRVIFVISPNSPFKEHTGDLLDFHHRCYLVNEAIKSNLSLSYSDIEAKLVSESEENKVYTYDTLCKLQELYEKDEIVLILGEDNFANIKNFKNYYRILQNFEICICPRTEKIVKLDYKVTEFADFGKIKGVNFLNSMPVNTISSTFVRNEVKNGHLNSVSSQLPKRVYNEIKYGKYYR